jgi:protein-S-isoprenylcysteine O-methyltransferase Ste14
MDDLVTRWLALRDHLAFDALGGPRPLRMATVINVQKGGTLLFCLLLMAATGTTTTTMWTYTALHGSYGLAWLIKDRVFPDPGWEKPVTLGGAVMTWLTVLGPYWVAPVLLALSGWEAPAPLLALATLTYAVGLVLMIGADAQKTFTLRVRRGLITDGFYARVRHPNYLGEMLIYGSFAAVSGHVLPWAVLAVVWSLVFVPNMIRKERSMSRYPEWPAYAARTGFLLPRLRAASLAGSEEVAA